jgi:hypothetical protein
MSTFSAPSKRSEAVKDDTTYSMQAATAAAGSSINQAHT